MIAILTALTLLFAAPQADSLQFAKLDAMLEEYTLAIDARSTEVKKGECDFLIRSTGDSLTVQHIATWLFDHYKEPERMGDEAVALHIYDTWFKSGAIAMRSEFDRFDADLFATFNRNTMLGMTAPEVELKNPCGRKVKVPQTGSHAILFFFDTSCAKCRLESQVLPGILEKAQFPAVFYAVYCGSDKNEWKQFRRSFKVKNRRIGLVHAWDPDYSSDFLRLYGVISTPRLYMTDVDGEIIGRRLEAESLQEMITILNEYYGQKEKQ